MILVADDVMPTTVMLERIFEYEGYQVKSVYDGISAMEEAQKLLPDLILLDINMPGMTGFEVLTKLRENAATASIPTILITAMGDHSGVVQGLNLGADDYLRKPFHPQELLARAQSKMKARQLEDSLHQRTQELQALLRMSEELSQHLEMSDLLDFILYLVADMLPCQITAIFHLDDDDIISDYRIKRRDGSIIDNVFDSQNVVDYILKHKRIHMWPQDDPLVANYTSGIVAPLQYGGNVRGILLILNDQEYSAAHMSFLQGISRPVTLALRNAELYEIQANYALHLEDMVNARTKELKSAQQMLVQSEKLASVGRLAASIAHEINNPLLPIQVNLEGVLEDLDAKKPVDREDIEQTLERVERIKYIVDRLRGFTGNYQVTDDHARPLDLNQVIEDIAVLNQKFFQHAKLNIETDLSPLPQLNGHRYLLEHVFMNLALNAKDAMQEGGVLRFKSWADGDTIYAQVEDNGSGIAPDLIDKIFEPFVSTKKNGNGLGLFISYDIVQKHNGSIEVTSRVNEGTRFLLRFPAITEKSVQV
ncbi:MAG: GAF domain-containing sensor histidine kinase [Anaerolineae bacterium]